MIGDAVLYAASRATHTAIGNVSRKLTWMAIAAVFLIAAFVFAIVSLYMVLEPQFGPLRAAGIIAGGCALLGVISLSLPSITDRIEARRRERASRTSPVASTVATVNQEAKEAVDYFGAMQVVGTAFLFGLGAARRLRR